MASDLNPHPNAAAGAGIYTNAPQIAAELQAVGVRAGRKTVAIVRHHAMLLETRIKARCSGRPGPRKITGDYQRSWNTTMNVIAGAVGVASATVGTDRPQSRRLEYGFVGQDRIGRTYNQPPFPHMGPAVAETTPLFAADMERVVSW